MTVMKEYVWAGGAVTNAADSSEKASSHDTAFAESAPVRIYEGLKFRKNSP